MASGVSFPSAAACVVLFVTAAVLAVSSSASATAQVFVVGDEPRGWRKPAPNDETYNHWAARSRFRVGDFLYFKYDKNDSVLVVSRDDYKLCGAARQAQRFDGGDTRFRLDRSGFFYFLSGAPGHCDAGQRMTVRVMAQGEGSVAPATAPSAMSPDDGGFSGGSKPTPEAGGSVTISKPPPPPPQGNAGGGDAKSGGAASVRAPPLVAAGCHVLVGAYFGFSLICLAP